MPVIEADLKLDHGQAGVLFMVLAVGYFVALMASGYVSSRLQHHRTIVVSALAMGLALLGTSSRRTLAASAWGCSWWA